jgi:uncharacterized protein
MTNGDVPELRMIETCDHCGACCMSTPVPPFEPGEEGAFAIPAEAMELIARRIAEDRHFERLPCVWFDLQSRRCRHYEMRPSACRRFEINSDLCRLSRWDEGLD